MTFRSALMALAASLALASQASAVPSYTEQTGQPCNACHIGGFGPELTPFGRQFKLEAYSMRAAEAFTLPVSLHALASYVHTNANQPAPPAPHYAINDNVTIDSLGVYIAGGFGGHYGILSQWSYDGVGRTFSWDMLDVRASTHLTVLGSDSILGIALDNAPGLDDVWNLPAWGFPYTDSALAPMPMATTVFDGQLMQTVLGTNAYLYWDSSIFATAGVYWTPGHGFLRAVGASVQGMAGAIDGAAPYFRIAYEKDFGDQNLELGAFAFLTDLFPGGDSSMGSDSHDDLGFDASYQYLPDADDSYTAHALYTHEWEDLKATFLMGQATSPHNNLNGVRLDASYYWRNTLSGTVSFFDNWGSKDVLLFPGTRTSAPESSGFLLEADYTPFGNEVAPVNGRLGVRLGVQYRIFTKFDGAATNFDGLGHNASDNDTLRLFFHFML
jgi:hypothetical protein